MELSDCPPGAEGYEDSVVQMAKKPDKEGTSCTKAEQEFQEHLASLKIRLDNGEARPMVERRGRDISGKWIYLCYPCAAVCSGELILQGHISGRKHKTKLGMRNAWPVSIFDDHPFNQSQKGMLIVKEKDSDKLIQKLKAEVDLQNTEVDKFDDQYSKYRDIMCHIQFSIDAIKAPIIGMEYLIEHPPEEEHHEPSYLCTLCTKQGHPRTIVNHMTCFWHRYNYINRHFQKAAARLRPLMQQQKYREGVIIVLNRIAASIENKYGRLRPMHIDKEDYEKDKDKIMQWIFKSKHLTELDGPTFEDVVDPDLMETLISIKPEEVKTKKDPSPPRVPAPNYKKGPVHPRSYRKERRLSKDLSDISDEEVKHNSRDEYKSRPQPTHKPRWEPYQSKREDFDFKSRYATRNASAKEDSRDKPARPLNYGYKMKLSTEKRNEAEAAAKKLLAYHEKNPEKHPLYPEEWKKFWNRRYKEIQTEGKDPSKHDFKPEWILYWTKRMKELHDEELRVTVLEIYRKMNISPPNLDEPDVKQIEKGRRRTPDRRRSPEVKRFPDHIKRPPREDYRRCPERRRSREPRDNRREHEQRRSPRSLRSADSSLVPDYRIGRRSPGFRPIPEMRKSQEQPRPKVMKGRSRSPLSRRSPPRTNIVLDSMERSRSPLSRRNAELPARNRSPTTREPPPSMQTVLVSDDELKPDDNGLSPWNSDNDIDSVCSVVEVRSVAESNVSRHSRRRDVTRPAASSSRVDVTEVGPIENVVATLRMLVALEDYLGSLGPKIVDLLTEALKMEKERANSSEELLVRDSSMVMIETAKEKLKGAAQAGLVAAAAAPAVRAAVVRAAATMHEADKRKQRAQKAAAESRKTESVPVAGVGEVDRAQIAQQMAAALIAQGKTDVTSEELAQLVDAVVGMAEAKKKAELAKKEATAERPKPKLCGTATALQMLQSAYDENDKMKEDKRETVKEEIPDAMDGLSDSDLETLLKNFNELSAEEQHSLIAYLKKLEAREPQRVERLRQYVSAAASAPPPPERPVEAPPQDLPPPPPRVPTPTPTPIKEAPPAVVLESDDDDYTVEEVIESAHQKVKEDQMRKEIEIVKKSLEELKEKKAAAPPATTAVDITKNLSSASEILALVQASVQSRASVNVASSIPTLAANTVVNTAQTRSFGDSLDSLAKLQAAAAANPTPPVEIPMLESPNENLVQQDQLPNNFDNTTYNQNDNYNQNNDFDQGNNYQGDSYDQGGSFHQNDNYDQGDYNQDGSYNNSQTYHQNDDFSQGDSYQNQPYQNDNYQNNQNQSFNQNQNQPYIQPWNNNSSHGQAQGYNDFNQGQSGPAGGHNQFQPRGSFTNGRQDNQYGNYNNNNNFRGRGRGNFNGPRGRGRGRY